jgi:hypothetical protein
VIIFSSMVYASAPNLVVDPNVISLTAFEFGSNPNPNVLTITNTGDGTLNWSIPDANLIMLPDWLTVTPTSGSLDPNESEPVTLSVDITGLSGGQYSYAFQVSDPTAQNSPQTMVITLKINEAIYVDDDGVNDPGPNNHDISDPLEDGSADHPYDTFQEGIDEAVEGDTIIVLPGIYYKGFTVYGKNIVLTSVDPDNFDIVANTVIDGSDYLRNMVSFIGTETSNCILQGFTITRGFDSEGTIVGNGTLATIRNCVIEGNVSGYDYGDWIDCGQGGGINNCDGLIANCIIVDNASACYGGGLYECDGTITNCVIADNTAFGYTSHGGGLYDCNAIITNCIIWGNNAGGVGKQLYNSSTPTYTCIQDWADGGTGNITSDPLFADVANNDYHLKSEYGCWGPDSNQWVYDDVTSPCIDAGDPNSMEWQNELWPHGGRINMGAYGGTPQASMSANTVGNIADFDHDDQVGVSDFMLFSEDWLWAEYLLDTDLNRNGVVDITDFAEFGKHWFWVEP